MDKSKSPAMEDNNGYTSPQVTLLTPGDEVPPELTQGHLVLQDDLQVTPKEGHQTLTRIVEQKTTTGTDSVHNTIIELHSPCEEGQNNGVNMDTNNSEAKKQFQADVDESLDKVEIRNNRNKSVSNRPNTLTCSPSDPGLLTTKHLECLQHRPKSLGYIQTNGLTESERLEALRNLQRKSKQPAEVFVFPSGMPDLIPESEIEKPCTPDNTFRWSGHVNTCFHGDKIDRNGYHDNRTNCEDNNNVCVTINPMNEPGLMPYDQNHLKYSGSNGELVRIDYEALFGSKTDKEVKTALTQSEEGAKLEAKKSRAPRNQRHMSISERALRTVVRQVSRKHRGYQVDTLQSENPDPPPKNYFDLALFTCCCCVSPLGLVALILSVKMDGAYRDGKTRKAYNLSHASLILSLLGIGVTLMLTVIILVTKFYYWNEVYKDRHLAGGT